MGENKKMPVPKSKPKNTKAAQAAADLKKAVRVVAKSLNLPAAAFKGKEALASAVESLMSEKPKMMKGGTMVAKKKMRGGGMAKMAKKKMMRGGVAAKKMRGGGMAKMAKKKMMRGGMAKKK
jgi:hypothetical protein